MQVPNMLTLSRFGIAAIIMALLAIDMPFFKSMAFVLFIVGGITDYLDGYLARNVYGVSSFGKLMDPLADKVMVCACFVAFVEIQLPVTTLGSGDVITTSLVPAWIVVIIISREFMVTGLRLLAANKGRTISAGKWGKHKTVWQIIAIVVILLGLAVRSDILRGNDALTLSTFDFGLRWTALALSVAVALITVASGVKYISEHSDLVTRNM
ncbi:MAG: CDP-diacylglycerol--glycerol-3-phosphate 3-phosphatidyltransferase [Candidatus Omnitrophota bacterium]|jgi:CDP-diacylglycerol--glycerol-3-phosphate 3-phosphatidyltransferase